MTQCLSHAHGTPSGSGRIRTCPEDFQVREELGFALSGTGEHIWLQVRKRAANTEWVVRRIAAFAGVKLRAISYAGLKDRHALAEQWFSVHLPGKTEPDWSSYQDPSFTVLTHQRHQRKLRRGALAGNVFRIVIRELRDAPGAIREQLDRIAVEGVPNYFGAQRFGHQGGNLIRAEAMFVNRESPPDRHRRGLYLSAARAEIFNRVLSRRVTETTWNRALSGDVMMLEGSHSLFPAALVDHDIHRRIALQDIHPSGPLWGSGRLLSQDRVRTLEEQVAGDYAVFCQGLERAGLQQERRALRLRVTEVGLEVLDKTAVALRFRLPPGSYATAVLRELVNVISAV